MRFGRPELIIHSLLRKVDELPPPKPEDLNGLADFGMAVQNLCDHVMASGQMDHMCNPKLLTDLTEKLPAQHRINWGMYKRQLPAVDLRAFSAFMSVLVDAALEGSVTTTYKALSKSTPSKLEKVRENYLNVHSAEEPIKKEEQAKQVPPAAILCLVCKDPQHRVKNCSAFKKMEPDSRWKFVQDNHLCRTCLGRHGRQPCKSQAICGMDGCELRHHSLLHSAHQKFDEISEVLIPKSEPVNAHHDVQIGTLFKVLPVRLYWKGRTVETFAFLDDGSSVTLIDQTLVNQLGVDDGEPLPLCLSWTGNVTRREPNSQRVSIAVSGVDLDEPFWLNDTRTVASLSLPKQTMNYEELAERYQHLRQLPLRSFESVSPGILIGSNNVRLITGHDPHESEKDNILATRTQLGWTIYGSPTTGGPSANFSLHISESTKDMEPHNMVKESFIVESTGVSTDKGPEAKGPERRSAEPTASVKELRSCHAHREYIVGEVVDFRKFSKWERLVRAVAYVHRFASSCRRRANLVHLDLESTTGSKEAERKRQLSKLFPLVVPLSQQDMEEAETSIWRVALATTFPNEVTTLLKDGFNGRGGIPKLGLAVLNVRGKAGPNPEPEGQLYESGVVADAGSTARIGPNEMSRSKTASLPADAVGSSCQPADDV